jgi:hypothetical protein
VTTFLFAYHTCKTGIAIVYLRTLKLSINMKRLKAIACFSLMFNAQTFAQQTAIENAIKQDQYNKHGKAGEDKLNEWFGGKVMAIKPQAEYNFPLSINQHIVTYKKGKVKDESDIRIYVNGAQKSYAMDGSQMGGNSKKKSSEKIITVFDADSTSMLMYNLTQKSLFGMNMNAFRSKASIEGTGKKPTSGKNEPSDMKCGKTGKTKTIMGYTCQEYVCKSESRKSSTQMWFTTDLKLNESIYQTGSFAPLFGNATGIGGAVLEINSYDDDGELATSMTVTDINTKENLKLVTAEFARQQMPAFNFEP